MSQINNVIPLLVEAGISLMILSCMREQGIDPRGFGMEFLKGVHWQIGSGNMVDIWSSSWVSSLPNFRISSQKPVGFGFKLNSLIDHASGQWKFQTLSSLFSVKEVAAIGSVNFSISSSEW